MPATPSPPARLIDLSRLVSRLGRGALTGVDRVELAWLRRFLTEDIPLFALVRTGAGYCLLDRAGAAVVADLATGARGLPDRPDRIARLTRRGPRGRAEAAVRAQARGRCLPLLLGRMLRRDLPRGVEYFNLGHSNLSARTLGAVRDAGGRIVVFVHDVIPLDHPEFCRPRTVGVFARKMRRVAMHADLVIFNSADTAARAEAHFAGFGRVPPAVVAHLGVDPLPEPGPLPPGIPEDRPLFLVLGTIEPRKNHALLLDVWERLAARSATPPVLAILGATGWNVEGLMRRIHASPLLGRDLLLLGALDDGARAALMGRARALLFPSLAEGFGLPLLEAMAQGLPALCSDLPVFHEIAGDYPVYLPVADVYSWVDVIEVHASRPRGHIPVPDPARLPDWDSHFDRVLAAM